MDQCDVLIVGGGPAGSSCAWKLRDSGLKVAILDKQRFPRDKVCGGWITPAVLDELAIGPTEYARGRILQPVTGFRISCIGGQVVETQYGRPISYGIRRYEFDEYLLKRSGVKLYEGVTLKRLDRANGNWIVNGQICTRMLIGAGGTFCPVARFLGARVNRETVITAQEAEFVMDDCQLAGCAIRAEMPELYFCSDLKGYGWCFRKQNVLNVGLGRLDPHGLSRHAAEFVEYLRAAGRLSLDVSPALVGHAYALYGRNSRQIAGDSVLLIGDAAGVAYAQSGEGIRPAIESGLMAAKVVLAAQGCYRRERLEAYRGLLLERFGNADSHWLTRLGARVPSGLLSLIGRRLMATEWFSREVVLNRWFLRQHEPAFNSV
ncbi:MAG TPA: NAD(P)/FAD-dependent oxidoreductase [Bryobacteraceae bacterium]|nr:NAD(P)/FAD-dependent oxidoreductase [Bryobacteraceae bacterium]